MIRPQFSNVMSFLKVNGIRGLVKKTDWPRYTEEEPEIYEQEELDALFNACDDQERLWFEFFLMTGMREQEVMYAYWSDINVKHATVRVSHKPDRAWTPKAYKEREIPIPSNLVESLTAWRSKAKKGCHLVFPTAGCNPKLNFLDDLKAVAERAKLDKDNFWLHKFRATFATRCLWADGPVFGGWVTITDSYFNLHHRVRLTSAQGRASKPNAVYLLHEAFGTQSLKEKENVSQLRSPRSERAQRTKWLRHS